jgi:hypothetical protein
MRGPSPNKLINASLGYILDFKLLQHERSAAHRINQACLTVQAPQVASAKPETG